MDLESHFKQITARKLLILCVMLMAGLLTVIGGWVVNQQSIRIIASIREQGLEIEVQTAKSYLQQYLREHQTNFYRIAQDPEIIANINHPHDFKNIAQYLKDQQRDATRRPIALFDNTSIPVYTEIEFNNKLLRARRTVARILSGSTPQGVFHLYNHADHQTFWIFVPIRAEAEQTIKGVLVAELQFNLNEVFSTITQNGDYWMGLSQPVMGVSAEPPAGRTWQRVDAPIEHSGLRLTLAISDRAMIAQRNQFLYWLGSMLLAMILIIFAIIYGLGKRLLVQPYQEIERLREALAANNQQLNARETEAKRLAQVAEYAHDAIIITDALGVTTWVNQAFVTLTGYQADEIIGKRPGLLLQGPLTSTTTRQKIGLAVKQHKSVRAEILNYKKDGQTYWVDVDITPVFNELGQLESLIGVKRDITPQRELQASLEQALERAEAASIAKSRFLASMSHEIRTPMNGVLGLAQLLDNTQLDEEQRGYLKNLYSSGQQMMAQLNNILDFSKIEANQMALSPSHFQLSELLGRIQSTYRAIAKQKHIEFILEDTTHPTTWYFADKERINQILLNLITNAIKFTLVGHVKLHLSERETPDEIALTMRVEDTGIGIDPERQSSIFAPFTQAESSTTRRFGGTGLGLAIVAQLCQTMQGKITLNSRLNEGSTFTVELQLAKGDPAREAHLIEVSRFMANQMMALIVEDNKTNALILKRFLETRGFVCDLAENGKEAIMAAGAKTYPLILMDNHMPEVDGNEATRAIRTFTQPETVIIGCTADAYAETRDEMIAAGVNSVITKPLDEAILDQVLHNHASYLNYWQNLISKTQQEATMPSPTQQPCEAQPAAPLQLDKLSERLGDDPSLLIEFLSLFVQEQETAAQRLQDAMAHQDIDTLLLVSHSLKGVAANLSATLLHDAALVVERYARAKTLPDPSLITALVDALERTLAAAQQASQELAAS
jgi:PAS domain S-box-containing protein